MEVTVSDNITANVNLTGTELDVNVRNQLLNVSVVQPNDFYWSEFFNIGSEINLIGDYSGGETDALVSNNFTTNIVVNRLLVDILGTGSVTATSYGTIPELANGVSILYEREDGQEIDVTVEQTIRSNIDWASYSYDARPDDYGSGPNGFSVRWTFQRADPTGITITPGRSFRLRLRDDFTGLLEHRFLLQGFIDVDT